MRAAWRESESAGMMVVDAGLQEGAVAVLQEGAGAGMRVTITGRRAFSCVKQCFRGNPPQQQPKSRPDTDRDPDVTRAHDDNHNTSSCVPVGLHYEQPAQHPQTSLPALFHLFISTLSSCRCADLPYWVGIR